MPEYTNATDSSVSAEKNIPSEHFVYNDSIVRLFMSATVFWSIFAVVFGIISGLLLTIPSLFGNLNEELQSSASFARFSPLQDSVALFAFVGNAVYSAVYFSTQRLCKVRLWSNTLAYVHFAVWQLILVSVTVASLLGHTQGGLIATAPWPIAVAIALVWIFSYGLNIFMTILKRRERYLYVSLWFYLASIIAVGLNQVANCCVAPTDWLHSESLLAGMQAAWRQSWYEYNLVAFGLIMPFLGIMYYYLSKAADRPLYSYKLSIVHFWSLVLLFSCASSRQLHFTPIPEWASTLGMLCGIMLWMPSWAGVVNGLCTLSGSSQKVIHDPALRFMVVGLLIYGITSFESSVLSIKSIDAVVHFTDWELAHSHAVAMGWIGFMTFGMIYWMMPRLFHTSQGKPRFANFHFWIALVGLLLTVFPEYCSGFIQAKKWSQLSDLGRLQYSFMETLQSVSFFWSVRVIGGCIYLCGFITLGVSMLLVYRAQPILNEARVLPALTQHIEHLESPTRASELIGKPVLELASRLDQFAMLDWHRKLERQPIRLSLYIILIICILSSLQLFPLIVFRSVPPIASVRPYTPLELVGRDIYVTQGCQTCHSQLIRPLVHESQRYGAISQAGEFVFDRPVQWGTRRIGPDLAREGGGKQSSFWHWRHFEDAAIVTPGSVMPSFKHLLVAKTQFAEIGKRILHLSELGTPYDLSLEDGETIDGKFEKLAHKQSDSIAAEIIGQGGPVAYRGHLIKDSSAVALIAYIQRLGTDLSRPLPSAPAVEPKSN